MFKILTPIFLFNSLYADCNILKKLKKEHINTDAYKQALTFYKKNKFDTKYISFIDFTKPSNEKRMYIINNKTNQVYKFKASHGAGYKHRMNYLYLKKCEYKGSRRYFTRPGFYKTVGLYKSARGSKYKWNNISGKFNGIKMQGLSKGINNKIFAKGVVIHSSKYVTRANAGRSSGCFTLHHNDIKKVSNMIKNNNMIYAYVPQCQGDMKVILKQVDNWKNICNYSKDII